MKSLHLLKSSLLSVAFFFTSIGCPAISQAWSLASQPVEGILVLRNGNVLRGKVQQLGKHYHVHMPNGKLQIRAKQVEMVCQNLEEAYQRRREGRGGSTADSHLELAVWCLRNDLFDQAGTELQEAHTTDPNHPRLALLQRQLKQSIHMAKRKKEQLQSEASAPPEPARLDPKALDKAPQWARVLFVRQIQPLIVHSCATGGCHQSGKGEKFQLNRLATEGVGHPEATQRNLAATLEQIDWQSADQSDLLRRAKQAHGSLSASAPLPPHKLQVLQRWVEQLAEAHQKAETHQKEWQLKLLPAITEIASLPYGSGPILNPPQQSAPQTPGEVQQASFEPNVGPTAGPTDPFDPATFNDRYAPAKKRSAELTVPHVLVPVEPVLIPAAE